MQDADKTKSQLIAELAELRGQVAAGQRTAPALEEGENKFRSLAESTRAHISIVQDDRYICANPAFLEYFELDADELQLVTPEDLMMGIMDQEAMRAAEPLWRAAVEQGDTRMQFEFQDLEGRWFQTNITFMDLGGSQAILSMDFDITEIIRAQTEMARADKMAALGEIVAGVAHEINNPNNFITFNLPILRKCVEAVTPLLEPRLATEPDLGILGLPYAAFVDDVHELLGTMEDGSARITDIVGNLKSYVRSVEDEDRQVVQVEPSVARIMTLVGKQVRKMVKRLEVTIAEGLPPVKMNVGKIEQVLINLLLNAGQAADKEDSWVEVSATATEGGVELRVEDNGAGITSKIRERIFEPFFTSKGRDQGTGLGLSIAQRIVEEHGGTISVDSTPGEGTCFIVQLPAP